ncbi:MAG: alpha-L-rhamnosidase [Verrucomicrobia bacterium]|nr:alpha-L-rhamnosidase [Verrucomicrobiota bacterium]
MTTARRFPLALSAASLAFLPLASPIARAAPTHLVEEAPVAISSAAPGVTLVDFGRVAFGNLRLRLPAGAPATALTVRFGEDFVAGRVNRKPLGTVRYYEVKATVTAQGTVVAPPPDVRNTWTPGKTDLNQFRTQPLAPAEPPPPAILTPAEWGVLTPFRWIEIEGWPGELDRSQILRRAAFASTWDDSAAHFSSSNELLDRVWELCRYSIKATTFAGLYVDGDRERIPYEADAYLNQLSHYAVDRDVQMARDTYDHLMKYGTWPTEWASHMVFMASADWWHTGDRAWLEARYSALRAKLLLDRVGPDGLVVSTEKHIAKGDIVDWPKGERDGFVFTSVNSVVNAFYLRALELMIEMGRALGRDAEANEYAGHLARSRTAFQRAFFDPATGRCRDGIGTDHSSLHANLFAYAFGLVPAEHAPKVGAWLQTRGMDCSVYVAQYYLEALFRAGAGPRALDLMLAENDRSWRHMLARGATISWEAWDHKYKPNQDWNHAWGAAPANLLPRFLLGVEAAVPGWSRARIAPQPSGLTRAAGRVPTPRGPIEVSWTAAATTFQIELRLPSGIAADVRLPAAASSQGVRRDGASVAARREGSLWVLAEPVSGTSKLEVF